MITCPKCTKENQDHYKFCLGCGAELPRDAAPKKFTPGTPPQGVPAVRPVQDEQTSQGTGAAAPAPRPQAAARPAPAPRPAAAAPAPAPAPAAPPVAPPAAIPRPKSAAPAAQPPAEQYAPAAPAAASAPVICPGCGSPNVGGHKFCDECGCKLPRPGAVSAAAPAAAAPPPQPAAPAEPPLQSVLLTALRADGSEAGSFQVPVPSATIGRDTGAIFAGDSYLSPRHATFAVKGPRLFIQDEGSLNGVYRKLKREDPVLLEPNDIFRIGQEILRVESIAPSEPSADGVERLGSPSQGYVGRLALVIGRDASGNAYPIPEQGLHMGRERGDVLFPEDGYVSGLHCRVTHENGTFWLTDLGSSNGTFVRLNKETELHDGEILLMGQQLFRVNTA